MSQEDVELVRSAFQMHAAEGIEAALSSFAPDCVWHTTDRWLDGSVYRGHAGVRRLFTAFAENFDDYGFELHDVRDAQDRVVALFEMTGRVKRSESTISRPLGLVVSDFRDGKAGDIQAFATWDEALQAVGLAE